MINKSSSIAVANNVDGEAEVGATIGSNDNIRIRDLLSDEDDPAVGAELNSQQSIKSFVGSQPLL